MALAERPCGFYGAPLPSCCSLLADEDYCPAKMTTYTLDESELQYLKDKVVLLTGCATGIGLETAKIAHGMSIHVLVGANILTTFW